MHYLQMITIVTRRNVKEILVYKFCNVMQMVFSKVYPACHNIANDFKPGSNFKKTDKHATDCVKAVRRDVK